MIYTYTRVSTNKQKVDRQDDMILEYCEKHNIKVNEMFSDVISGKVTATKRKSFLEMFSKLQPNDTLIITEVDRLGRDWTDIEFTYNKLIELRINLVVIEFDLLNIAATKLDNLEERLARSINISIYCYSAQKEREKISNRTKQALQAKKKQGVKLGAERQYDHNRVIEFKKRNPKLTLSEIALELNISKTSVHRILKGMN